VHGIPGTAEVSYVCVARRTPGPGDVWVNKGYCKRWPVPMAFLGSGGWHPPVRQATID
jgi:hypothetical protein